MRQPYIPGPVDPNGGHRCIHCRAVLTGESDGYGMFDRLGFTTCRAAEDGEHMCHCATCHCGGECPEHLQPPSLAPVFLEPQPLKMSRLR